MVVEPSSAIFSALSADATADCLPLLTGVTGTHALLLDALDGAPPSLPGLGRWTSLCLRGDGRLDGPLRAGIDELPFIDGSFCLVLIRHAAGRGALPERIAQEAARVLAPHGLLVVIELHPWSGWRLWLARERRHGLDIPQATPPQQWVRALLGAGLSAGLTRRCGAPWPRQQGLRGLPRWMGRGGGAYLLDARKRNGSGIAQRLQPARPYAAVEHASLVPGAQRSPG